MTKKKKVLLAEDDSACAAVMKLTLGREGFEVLHAPNGRIAVELARAEDPDLILMDVNMPEMDGVEACRLIKSDKSIRDVPLLFLTANDAPADIVEGLAAGGDDYIMKPPLHSILVARMTAQLRVRELHEENISYLGALHSMKREADTAMLLGGVSHNYNNLLAPLLSTASMVEKAVEMGDHEDALEMVGEIAEQATKLKAFNDRVAQVRNAPSPGEGSVPLGEVLGPVVEFVACALPSAITFDQQFDPAAGEGRVPHGKLDDALVALLVNSKEALETAGGTGTIRLEASVREGREGRRFVIRILDDGPGVMDDELAQVLKPFFSTKNAVGAGLGLTLAQRTVTRMNGTLSLENRDGGGLAVTIELPAADGD